MCQRHRRSPPTLEDLFSPHSQLADLLESHSSVGPHRPGLVHQAEAPLPQQAPDLVLSQEPLTKQQRRNYRDVGRPIGSRPYTNVKT